MIRVVVVCGALLCAACGGAPVKASVNQPPVPVLDAPTSVSVGGPVHVDASKSSDVDGAIHDAFVLFGDGSPATIVSDSPSFSADHTYAAPGLYLIELYVDDDQGASSRARLRIQVTP